MKTNPEIKQLYNGFYINTDSSNNAFSFAERSNKKIWVAPLVEGKPDDLRVGKEISFNEIEDGSEKRCRGLDRFVHWQLDGKHIFLFDNHNHAFFFWLWAYRAGKIEQGQKLIHIDQHSDMREPQQWPAFTLDSFNLQQAFDYTNGILNVGNFIRPALHLGLFSDVVQIDGNYSLNQPVPEQPFVLDLDLDFFAPEMDFIDAEFSIPIVKAYIDKAAFITCASSPFFINQQRAISIFRELFG